MTQYSVTDRVTLGNFYGDNPRFVLIGLDLHHRFVQVRIEGLAERFDRLHYNQVISRDLKVMDMTAICLCRDHGMPITVFDMNAPGALERIAAGDKVGTLIDSGCD